jgi:hypothetical protein
MPNDQWRVLTEDQCNGFSGVIDIPLLPEQKPRQGVNTCGANEVFIFSEKPADLPDQFIFPLATKDIWKSGDMRPHKWILLPYDQNTGKPLSWHEIEQFAGLSRHLMKYRDRLEKRKGTLIQSAISKGIWWSLLGVGPYSFAPYKVIWEAYGKSHFRPIVLHNYAGQVWQANQAMQAFIPCWDLCDAKRISDALKHTNIQSLLQQLNGDGKCNWAQPGKIKKVMSFGKPAKRLGRRFVGIEREREYIKIGVRRLKLRRELDGELLAAPEKSYVRRNGPGAARIEADGSRQDKTSGLL